MILCDPQTMSALRVLLARYGLDLVALADDAPIPGSYWGAPEAGLIRSTVYARADTPLHSVLHEAAHVVCMDDARRATLNTDAGGEYCEEDAVCFLQVLLAGELGLSVRQICADMDAWGYSFRLGSAYAWFTQDAEDTRRWLLDNGLITLADKPTWRCRKPIPVPPIAAER
jgi:hypothetical protein